MLSLLPDELPQPAIASSAARTKTIRFLMISDRVSGVRSWRRITGAPGDPCGLLSEYELGGGAERARVARDEDGRDDRLAPGLEVVADLVLRSDQGQLLDQL